MTTGKPMDVRERGKKPKHVEVSFGLLYSHLLSTEEKMCFIALKSFVEFGKDAGTVWPTMDTVCEITRMSRPRATRVISSLVKKGIVEKKRQGLNKPNIYTLSDNPHVWESTTIEEMQERSRQQLPFSTDELIAELERRGIISIEKGKEKEPISSTDQSNDIDPSRIKNSYSKDTNIFEGSQPQDVPGQERYSQQDVEELFDFSIIRADLGDDDADMMVNILYDIMNTRKKTIRVGGEERPSMVVIGRLMKLDYSDIEYVIRQYNNQRNEIRNPTAYITTLLYTAKEQSRLNMLNQGHVNGDF